MASYKELKAKAEDLMRQAEAARKAETAAVIAEIRKKMSDYGITVGDLGGSDKKAKTRKIVAAKYRNPAGGETWSGRGRMPKWLAALEAAGRKREEFLVGEGTGDHRPSSLCEPRRTSCSTASSGFR